jgi:hypothetical protein
MHPFRTTLQVPAPSREYLRGCKLEALSTRRGRLTRVTLPDGFVVTFVGAVGKTDGVRNALAQRARGYRSEAPPASERSAALILAMGARCTSCTHSRALHEGGKGACAHLTRKGARLCDCRAFVGQETRP